MMRAPHAFRIGFGGWPRAVVAVRAAAARHGLTALLTVSLALIILGKADVKFLDWLGGRAADAVVPVLSALKEPVAASRDAADAVGSVLALREENQRLRAENRRLLVWQAEAARLAVQNEALREVLKMPRVDEAPVWTVARIVADPGGPFVRTLLLDAGADRGIQSGMAVIDENGLVGRIVQVGRRSARVLLLTDLNSKVPVITEGSRDQAILEGTNDRRPELRFLPMNPHFAIGDRVLTSGTGGILPPGLLVGEIAQIKDRHVIVRPYVDWHRLDYVAVLLNEPVPPPELDPVPEPAVPATPSAVPSAGAGGSASPIATVAAGGGG